MNEEETIRTLAQKENGVTPFQVATALHLPGNAAATRWLTQHHYAPRFNAWQTRGDWVWFPSS